jgi:hypothetical protein
MSAAAIIGVRIKRIFSFLRERGAVSPESAIPEVAVPYSDRWYYGRLIEYGAVKRVGDKCYLDEALAQSYLAERRKRALIFTALAVVGACLLWLIRGLM